MAARISANSRIGKRFGRLLILSIKRTDNYYSKIVECVCDCGNIVEKRLNQLVSGKTKSCGCLVVESSRKTMTTHGKCYHPNYHTWRSMIDRCVKEKTAGYRHYGGRGITVCARWLSSLDSFIEDMGERPSKHHSIDRICVDGNYEPDNCRWATRVEQANNTSRSIFIEARGIKMTVAQWAHLLKVNHSTLNHRRLRGWSDSEIIEGRYALKDCEQLSGNEGELK